MANQATLNAWNGIWSRISTLLGGGNSGATESPFGSLPIAIEDPLTLYIETTGNDSNPGTLVAPFRTIQKAINYLRGFEIKAAVTLQVGIGTFDGFILDGQKMVGDSIVLTGATGLVASITIQGTWVTATGVTSTTGTVTSSTTCVLNDTGQTWTVDELKGKVVRMQTATSAASYARIASNTATQIKFVSSLTPLAGSTYTIMEHGTIVQPNVQISTATTVKYGTVLVGGDIGSAISTSNPGLVVSTLKYTSLGAGANFGSLVFVLGSGARCLFTHCEFEIDTGASVSTAISGSAPNGTIVLSDVFLRTNKASVNYIVLGRDTTITYVRLYMLGTGQTGQVGFLQSSNFAGVINSTAASLFEALGTVYKTSFGGASWSVMGTYINNIAVLDSAGDFVITDSKANIPVWAFTSAGNTNFVLARGGSRIAIHSNVPSGLATNDITMSTANPVVTYTLTAMRALTPAAVVDALGTVVGTPGVVF